MRKIAAGCWHCAWRFSSIVILNLLQDPRSIEMATLCIFSVKCSAAEIPDQVRNDGDFAHDAYLSVYRYPLSVHRSSHLMTNKALTHGSRSHGQHREGRPGSRQPIARS